MGITALGFLAARQTVENNQGRAIGWMTASFGFGQLLGPAIAGQLVQMTQGFEAPAKVLRHCCFVVSSYCGGRNIHDREQCRRTFMYEPQSNLPPQT